MKKLLVVLLALTALSVAAFADDVVWTYGLTVKTGATITLGDSTSVPSATLVPSDADDSPAVSRLRFDADAALGDFSAHVRVGTDLAGNITGTVFLPAWWVNSYFLDKMVQLQFGNLDHSVTDTVNKGWGGINVEGGQVVVTPMTGLSVGMAIPVAPLPNQTLNEGLAGTKIGFAYTMPNLAIVKATYMNAGNKMADLAAGVEIDAVANLKVQFELLDSNLGDKDFAVNKSGIELFEFASYAMGPLTPSLEMYQQLPADSAFKMMLYVKPGIDYVVMEGTAVGATVKYTSNPAWGVTGTPKSALAIDPYVAFTFNAKAALKIDAAYTLPDLSATSTWMLPININFKYSF